MGNVLRRACIHRAGPCTCLLPCRHGGAGLTLAWGCAADAASLVQEALAARQRH